jgi:hypothetical protein
VKKLGLSSESERSFGGKKSDEFIRQDIEWADYRTTAGAYFFILSQGVGIGRWSALVFGTIIE